MEECRMLSADECAQLENYKELLKLEWPPCRAACPVHTDIRGYLEAIAGGRYSEALATIREVLPFAGVCGRVCHHPCERECRRNDVDAAPHIRNLKRFVAEYDYPEPPEIEPPVQDKEKVAVIGAGPSGLTAALDLAKLGYKPTVFEKHPVAGGMLATGIPSYRLPREVLQKDIDYILAHGIELKTEVEVGKDITIEKLREDGYKAIIVAVGLSKSVSLPIPGAEAEGVHLTVPFLREVAFGRKPQIGKDVVIIGGGNVAVDVARCALRLGAERVRMVCLENEEEQPAWPWEIEEAEEEGIETIHRRGPKRIVEENGKVKGIEFKKVTRVFDEQGRFSPEYDESDVLALECDTVIFSIGQRSDNDFAEGSDIRFTDRGRLVFDNETAQTSARDIFACGEVVTGPGAAVQAVANGHRVAKAVAQYLQGKPIELSEDEPPTIGKLEERIIKEIPKAERVEIPMAPPEERKKNFDQVELGLSEENALYEARRCMNCGAGPVVIYTKCASCQNCRHVCPFDIPVVTDIARMYSNLCQGCGICATECPANAIIMAGFEPREIKNRTDEALANLAGAEPKLVVFASRHRAPAELCRGEHPECPAGAQEIYMPSLSMLDLTDILYAFEQGADGVLVLSCGEGGDRYPGVDERIRKRVDRAADLIEETGIDKERLRLVEGVAGNVKETDKAISEMLDKLKEISG